MLQWGRAVQRRSWPASARLVIYISFSFLTRIAINSTEPLSYCEYKQYPTSKTEILRQYFLHMTRKLNVSIKVCHKHLEVFSDLRRRLP